jgi:hypothetical protein
MGSYIPAIWEATVPTGLGINIRSYLKNNESKTG